MDKDSADSLHDLWEKLGKPGPDSKQKNKNGDGNIYTFPSIFEIPNIQDIICQATGDGCLPGQRKPENDPNTPMCMENSNEEFLNRKYA